MAIVNAKGQIMANLSQTIKVFTTKQDYDLFVNRLPNAEALDAFAVFKCWERPYVLVAEGKTIVLAEEQKTIAAIPNLTVGQKYAKDDVVTNGTGDKILRAKEDMVFQGDADMDKFETIADEYAFARPAENGYLPKAGDLMSEVGPDGTLKFYLVKKTLNNVLSDTNTLSGQTEEFVIDLQRPHVPEIPNFIPNHNYHEYEAMTYGGLLYRAKKAFQSGDSFNAADFELISRVTHALEDFTPGYHYAERELIFHDNQLYAARKEFTAGATFDVADWYEIGQSDHIFFYDATQGYPERVIVINGQDCYVTLKEVPVGTELTNGEFFLLLSFVPQEMTQAQFDALPVKPAMTMITDSIYDMAI